MPSDGGTTDSDYRWRFLSTLWALGYGFGFPAVLASPYAFDAPGSVHAALTLAWGATVVYVIGPENVEAWKSLRGGSA